MKGRRRSARVLLTREIVRDDVALGEAIGAVITGTPKLVKYTKRVRRHQRALRKTLNERQWHSYMLLEESVNTRVSFETDVLVAWAFKEGRREGRGR